MYNIKVYKTTTKICNLEEEVEVCVYLSSAFGLRCERPRESAELRVFLSLWVFFTRRCLRSLRTLGACVVCEREWTVVSGAYEILSSLKTEQ